MRASSYVVGTPLAVAHCETIIQSSLFPGWRFHLCSSAHVAFFPVSFSTVCSADRQNVSFTSISTPSTSKIRISGSTFFTARFATPLVLSSSALVYLLPRNPLVFLPLPEPPCYTSCVAPFA